MLVVPVDMLALYSIGDATPTEHTAAKVEVVHMLAQ